MCACKVRVWQHTLLVFVCGMWCVCIEWGGGCVTHVVTAAAGAPHASKVRVWQQSLLVFECGVWCICVE
jgi:hypothetical protein